MLALDNKSRKRSSRNASSLSGLDDNRKKARRDDQPVPVICLTGLTPEEKGKYHQIIEKLGGRFTRNLDSTVNTHLIANAAEGAKYEAATSIPALKIVRPGWLDACAKKQKWLSTRDFLLPPPGGIQEQMVEEKETVVHKPLLPEVEQCLQMERAPCQLFLDCHVYLVGLDGQPDVKTKLSRLLRRGMATIHWHPSENITHVIVADGLEEYISDAARMLVEQHANFPSVVSPRWIIASWNMNQLQRLENFQPTHVRKVVKPVDTKKTTAKREKTDLFQGSLFAFLRVSPPNHVVDFNRDELEQLSSLHGGRILTQEIVDALRIDKSKVSVFRKCFVVCWGSYEKSSLSVHSLLAQIVNEELAEVISTTPIWLRTCVAEQKLLLPSRLPEIFIPSSRPLQKIFPSQVGLNKDQDTPIRVCVTGYTGFRRKAIQLILEAMGADYDDSLRQCTSHLICKDASGSKYEKAKEWNVHTVSVDWLYHIAAYGLGGSKPGSRGCEAEFSILSPDKSKTF